MPSLVIAPLQFTKLRISGFKSFCESAEVQIEPGLTGIVGPNGCGKSNIVEALRWVMGESSARGLRGAEMEDVIFAGAAFRGAHDLAEVTLRMVGPVTGLSGFADDTVEVARRISRGAGSNYRINGRDVRARDVQLIFADAASGSRSAAIIGQGQIGTIVDAKPDERRRLLEDAAGIGGLHARRREAELRLGHTAQNLERVRDLLQQRRQRLEGLQKQAREAERYRKTAAELRAVEAMLLRRRHEAAQAELAQAGAALGATQAAAAQVSARVTELRAERIRLAELAEAARLRAAELATAAALAAERHSAAEADRARRVEARDEQERQLAEAIADRDRESAALADCARVMAAAKEELAALTAAADGLAARRLASERALAMAQAEVEAAEATWRDAVHARELATGRVEQTAIEAGPLEERRAAVAARAAALAASRAVADADRGGPAPAEAELGDARHCVGLVEARLTTRRVALREARAVVDQAMATAARTRDEAQACRAALEIAARRAADLAARAQLIDRAVERAGERRAQLEAAARALEARRNELGAMTDQSATAKARRALDAHRAELALAEAALDAAGVPLAAAERQAADAEETERRLAAEAAALAALVAPAAAAPLADRLIVADDLAAALAAALGDELLLGEADADPAHWRAFDPLDPMLPALPEGAVPLGSLLSAPAVLRRRLSQVGLIEPERAAALQAMLRPGQRLVSRRGGLWRWDGLVRAPAGNEAAARLDQRRRLAELREISAAARDAAAAARRQWEAARATADRAAEERRRRADRVVEREAELATRNAELERARAETVRLEAEYSRVAAELIAVRAELAELETERAAINEAATDDSISVLEARHGNAKVALGAAEAELAAAREALDALEAAMASDEQELAAARERLDASDARRRAAAALQAERQRREAEARVEREAIAAEERLITVALEDLAARRRSAAAAAAAAGSAASEREARLARARQALATAAAAADEAQQEERRSVERADRLRAQLDEAALRQSALVARLRELEQRCAQREAALAAAPREMVDRALDELADACEAALAAGAAAERAAATARTDLAALDAALSEAEESSATAREATALAQAELARAQAQLAAAATAIQERVQLPLAEALRRLPAEPGLADLSAEALDARLARLRATRERIGPVNLRATQELAELEIEITEAEAEAAEIEAAVGRFAQAIATLNREARERLKAAFTTVDAHFTVLFQRLFGGGRAILRLTNLDDPLAAGLELEASPPGKKLAHVSLLSGGEKTLTALALVFAFFLARPSPLCVLDEVDAPLDDANVDRFLGLMREIAEGTNTRFLCVTHHPLTMARMDRLYGVTMAERGVSKLVSVALADAVELRATA